MGGYGSGRTSTKRRAEHCRSLDVNQFHRTGCLRTGWQSNWVWSRDGQEVARINCRTEERRIVLDYNVRERGGDWELISQAVPITHQDCNYGGQRPYFACSGVVNGQHCGRRVGKLFLGGKYFLCGTATASHIRANLKRPVTAHNIALIKSAWRWAANPALPI